jgi:hypothetical protein
MPKTKISEFSATPANNTDIDSINIAEGCAPSGINDAIRELMAQLKDFQTGAVGDSFNGPIGTSTAAAGAFTTLSASGTTTLSGLTASTALALDASKNVVSVTNTGTGNNVLATSPTLVTPALGTPSALVGTNITGTATSFNINGTVGATTPTTGAFTTLAASGAVTLSGGTANGVAYLNGSKVVTSGSALTFDGTTFAAPITSLSGNGVVLTVDRTGTGGNDRTNVQFSNSGTVRGGIGTVGASDGIYFNQGTTEGMRLTSTGLGIGTSSPSSKLDVTVSSATAYSTGVLGNGLRLYNNSATTGQYVGISFYGEPTSGSYGGATIMGTTTGNGSMDLAFSTRNGGTFAENMRITAAGNLGIGTTGPVTKLQVNSGSSYVGGFKSTVANGFIAFQDSGTSGALTDGNVALGAISNDLAFRSGGATRMRLDSAGILGVGLTPTSNNYLIQSNSGVRAGTSVVAQGTLQGYTGAGIFMSYESTYGRIESYDYGASAWKDIAIAQNGGNVGIGISTPANKLDVNGTTFLRSTTNIYSSTGGAVNSSFLTFGSAALLSAASIYSKTDTSTAGNLVFATAQSGTGTMTERGRFDSGGNLGIGTTSPAVRLDVSGGSSADVISIRGRTSDNFSLLSFATSSGTKNSYIGSNDSTILTFYTNGFNERMRIHASGGVSVGTTTDPSAGNVTVASNKYFGQDTNAKYIPDDASIGGALYTGGGFRFFTGGANERCRIDSSGNFLVGTTSVIQSGTISIQKTGVSSNGISIKDTNAAGGVQVNFVNSSGTQCGSISHNGTLTVYNTTSDYRLKTVVGAVTGHGARIDALEPVEYTWKADGSRTRGFLAHKFQEVYAGSVSGDKDAVDANGNPVYQAMQASTSEVIADLVAEIQSLRKRLADAGI